MADKPIARADKPRIRIDEAARAIIREDGWANLLSGYGTRRDPSESNRITADLTLTRDQLDALYRADGIGRRIVDIPAEEMTRQWVGIQGQGGDDILSQLDLIHAKQKFNKALRWAGLYGGSVMVMLINDGQTELTAPLRENAVRGVNDLIVYDRHQVYWTYADVSQDPNSVWFGKPEFYTIQPVGGTQYRVHASRALVFDGEDLPDNARQSNQGWGDSRLQPVFRALGRYGEGLGGVSSIIRDFILPVLSMKNLSDMIASGQEDVVNKRLEILGVSRSILNVLLIDADEEGYEKKASSVSGIDKLLAELRNNIAASAGYPQTKIFGKSAEGLNATGEGDARDFYDTIKGEQEDKLLPNLRRLVEIMDSGRAPADRKVEAKPLWQQSAKESAETLDIMSKGLTLLVDYGLVTDDAARDMLVNAGFETGQ